MNPLTRRDFLRRSALPAAALAAQVSLRGQSAFAQASSPGASIPVIVDTNVHLFDWPFRRLKYGQTAALVAKLRRHRIQQAWAGSFEALLHKDMAGVNARLAGECRARGEEMLIPFGSVNPMWPDWEEDLRRCHEVHRMPGIRLHPSYQNYALDHPDCARLIRLAAARGLIIQIVIELEDERVQHPLLAAPVVNAAPLVGLLADLPQAKVQLLNGQAALRNPRARPLAGLANVVFDVSHFEGVGAVGRLLEGNHWYIGGKLPVERLLFGSHAPFFPVENTLLKLFESPLTGPQLQAIMEDNARRLLRA